MLREKGRAGNRGGAAATKKANFEDASIFDARRKLENVSTDGVADFNASCRVGEVTSIARITEVIEDGFAEHFQKYLSNLFESGMRLLKATYILRLKSIRITRLPGSAHWRAYPFVNMQPGLRAGLVTTDADPAGNREYTRVTGTLRASQVCTLTSRLCCDSYARKLFASSYEAIL